MRLYERLIRQNACCVKSAGPSPRGLTSALTALASMACAVAALSPVAAGEAAHLGAFDYARLPEAGWTVAHSGIACAPEPAGRARLPVAMTLQEAFDTAGPGDGYDKLVILGTGERYTGGLLIGPILSLISGGMEGPPGMDVMIRGNGAIIDLEGGQICISYCNNRLDMEDCVILNGNVRFRGLRTAFHDVVPVGSIRYVTFYKTFDYCIRLQGSGAGILLERNLVVDALDTGFDFHWGHGAPIEWLPTGTNISFSVQMGQYGVPQILDNWSFHSDPVINDSDIAHFSLLCEHG